MTVIPGFVPDGVAPGPAIISTRSRLDVEAASAFLRTQADCLRYGLEHADRPVAVQAVLRAHDNVHGTWLSLIAAVEAANAPTGEMIGRLYAFHGRVAGALESRLADRPCPAADRGVRALLSARLGSRTDESVAALTALAPHAAGTGSAT